MKLKNFGFTVVEVLAATAIIAVISLAGITTISQLRKTKNRSVEVCRLHAASVVEQFRSVGYFSAVSNFLPDSSVGRIYTGNASFSMDNFGIPDSYMWPSTEILSDGVAPTVNNSILIMSSLNVLLAIYNSNGAYCSGTDGANYTGKINGTGIQGNFAFPPASTELKDAILKLKIEPYDAYSGNSISCPANLRIAPEPRYPDNSINSAFTDPAPGEGPKKATRGSVKTNVGLKLQVKEEYVDEDGKASTCIVEQKFQYPADTNPPAPPDYMSVTKLSAADETTSCPATPGNQFKVILGYQPTTTMEPGSVLVCRDTSIIPTSPYTVSDPNFKETTCNSTTPVLAYNNPPNFYPPAGPALVGIAYADPAGPYTSTIKGDMTRSWMPCDKVSACGVPPTSATVTNGASPQYTLIYNNLPALCRVNIQVAALDTASNASTSLDPFITLGHNINTRIVGWDVPMPLCGTACGPAGAGSATFANVYFNCGACP